MAASCFSCGSDYKVVEVDPGVFSCSGFCKKMYERDKGAKPSAPVAASSAKAGGRSPSGQAKPPSSTPASAQAKPSSGAQSATRAIRSSAPTFKAGEFCRAACKAADNAILEAAVVEAKGNEVVLKFLGNDVTQKAAMKELVPSKGRSARDEQVAKFAQQQHSPASPASSSQWKVGDKCRAVFSEDNTEYVAVIQSINAGGGDDSSGTANICYEGYGNTETKRLSDLKPVAKVKVGDAVSAVFAEDEAVYEATVLDMGESEGYEYCTVEFLGYGNQQTVWMSDLKPSQGEAVRKVQLAQALGTEPEPEKPPVEESATQNEDAAAEEENATKKLKVGDFCRAIFHEDETEYEGELTEMNKDDDGNEYCTVRFLGYGNEVTVWLTDLKPSQGHEARKQQTEPFETVDAEEEAKTDVEAAEQKKAESEAKTSQDQAKASQLEANISQVEAKTGPVEDKVSPLEKAPKAVIEEKEEKKEEEVVAAEAAAGAEEAKFKVGDFCRALYHDDGLEYEGEVTEVNQDEEGNEYCTVKFLGYGNEITAWLADLKPSDGEKARKEQSGEDLVQPTDEPQALTGEELAANDEEGKDASETVAAKDKDGQQAVAAEEPTAAAAQTETVAWKVGDFCRCVYAEDGLEYEGKIEAVGSHEGSTYYTVAFLGYGNQESIWEDDMKPTEGVEARKKQLQDCGVSEEEEAAAVEAEVEASSEAAVEAANETTVETEAPTTTTTNEALAKEDDVTDTVVQVVVAVADTVAAAAKETTADTSEERIWKAGDFCRAVFSEDSQEYEAEIQSIEMEDCGNRSASVVFVGYGNLETVWLADLLESKGEEERNSIIQLCAAAQQQEESADGVQTSNDDVIVNSVETANDVTSTTANEVVNRLTAKTPLTVDTTTVGDKKKEEESSTTSVGDFCRVVYRHQGSKDPEDVGGGQPLEGLISSVSEANPQEVNVRILGMVNQFQRANVSELLPTLGPASRESQVLRFRNEKVTPSKKTAAAAAATDDVNNNTSTASLSPTAAAAAAKTAVTQAAPVQQLQLSLVQHQQQQTGLVSAMDSLVAQLSAQLDLAAANSDLRKKLTEKDETIHTLTQQIEGLRSGNMELVRQLNSGNGGGSSSKKVLNDTVEVAVRNLTAERERYAELERKHNVVLADEKALIAKIDSFKKELMTIKAEKQINENIKLKAATCMVNGNNGVNGNVVNANGDGVRRGMGMDVSSMRGNKVVVSNLDRGYNETEVREFFAECGAVRNVKKIGPHAFEVVYTECADAQKSVETYHNGNIDGKPMKVQIVGFVPKSAEL